MADFTVENELVREGYNLIAGCDETGMGCLAGDVYVGVVIFPADLDPSLIKGVDDSKKKSSKQREGLVDAIKNNALGWSIATASVKEIDEHNIYWARFIAARRALSGLKMAPDYVLIDGNAEIPEINAPQRAIIKGDTISLSIAAASILAKVARDEYIEQLADQVHADYGWKSNKAYYSPGHIKALKAYGKTDWHRAKFVSKFI